MSLTDTAENELLNLILNNTAIANIGDAGGLQPSTADGVFYISLHTADPGEAGNQTTSEAAYTGYARVALTRDGTGWSVASGVAQNALVVTFAQCTAGTANVTHFGIGTSLSGAGKLLLRGTMTQTFAISAGVVPKFPVSSMTVTAA